MIMDDESFWKPTVAKGTKENGETSEIASPIIQTLKIQEINKLLPTKPARLVDRVELCFFIHAFIA